MFCRKKKTFESYMTIKRLPTQGAASVLEPHTSLDSLSTVDPLTRAPASPPEHPQTSSGQASPLGMSVSGTPLSLTPGQILSALPENAAIGQPVTASSPSLRRRPPHKQGVLASGRKAGGSSAVKEGLHPGSTPGHSIYFLIFFL